MSSAASYEKDLVAVALLDAPVRRRLYEWVCDQGRPVGREEAARSLGVSRPLAAFHLERLAEAGLLEAGYQRLTGRTGPGAGRPARVYTRASREFNVSLPPRHYELAADLFAAALQQMGDGNPPPELLHAAHAMGERMARHAPAGSATSLIEVLDEAGYEPMQDAGTIRLRNCPFDALVDEHRLLVCGTNLALAQGLLDGLSDGPKYEPHLDSRPGSCCVVLEPT